MLALTNLSDYPYHWRALLRQIFYYFLSRKTDGVDIFVGEKTLLIILNFVMFGFSIIFAYEIIQKIALLY